MANDTVLSAIVDPWLYQKPSNADAFSQVRAFRMLVRQILPERGFHLVPTIDYPRAQEELSWISLGPAKREIFMWWSKLIGPIGEGGQLADIEGRSVTDLPDSWRRALWNITEPTDIHSWRDPIILVPLERQNEKKKEWPDSAEVQVNTPGKDAGGVGDHMRVLAVIEALDQHSLLNRYFDPWIYKGPCDPVARQTPNETGTMGRRNFPQCLPRPPQLRDVALKRLRGALAEIPDQGTPVEGSTYYFLPQPDWDPLEYNHEAWRRGELFQTQTKKTRLGPLNGPIDRMGWIWWWDSQETHWDVQHPREDKPGTYATIGYDGRVRKCVYG